MNEKYVQALILGSLIGFAIILDDFIGPKSPHRMQEKHIMMIDGDSKKLGNKKFKWKGKPGKRKDLHEINDHNVMIFKSKDGLDHETIDIKISASDASELDIVKILHDVGKNLPEEDMVVLKKKLKAIKKELKRAQENNEDVNIEVEIDIEKD